MNPVSPVHPAILSKKAYYLIHYSLFIIHYSLFIIHYSLSIIHYPLFIIHYSLSIIHYSLFIIMTFLIIDTSGNNTVVVLGQPDGSVLDATVFEGRRTLSQKLIGVIDDLLARNDLSLTTLAGFAVGLGPGSFTGLRVGLTTIKTLAQVTGKPCVGIASLEAYSHGVESDYVVVVTPSRMGEVYCCIYHRPGRPPDSGNPLSACGEGRGGVDSPPFREGPGVGPDADILIGTLFAASIETGADICSRLSTAGTVTICGDPQCVQSIPGSFDRIEEPSVPPNALAALASARFHDGRVDDFLALLPLYVVPPSISTPRDVSILQSRM
jgi:tRNA threonylcarbamoyladenosine biosynthesis protein TsaB